MIQALFKLVMIDFPLCVVALGLLMLAARARYAPTVAPTVKRYISAAPVAGAGAKRATRNGLESREDER